MYVCGWVSSNVPAVSKLHLAWRQAGPRALEGFKKDLFHTRGCSGSFEAGVKRAEAWYGLNQGFSIFVTGFGAEKEQERSFPMMALAAGGLCASIDTTMCVGFGREADQVSLRWRKNGV